MSFFENRNPGYALLSGRGIEIGAFEHPAPLPAACKVEYCDAVTPEQAQLLFPEVDTSQFVKVDHLIELDKTGLAKFADRSFDFVIFNHVIEHVVNPVFALREILRVLKVKGHLVLAAPDKRYTYDRDRPLTPWLHLRSLYKNRVSEASLDDYMDIARFIHPRLLEMPRAELETHLTSFRNRREHLHVWTSETFKDFLLHSLRLVKVSAHPVYESLSADNQYEYFGVWQKDKPLNVFRWVWYSLTT
jgi:SAM-dependent methyltransferase